VPLSNSLIVIASFGVALPFFLLQMIRRGWRRGPEMLFLLIIFCHTGLYMVYGSIVRYRIPIEPLIVVMAITGFCWIYDRFQHNRSRQLAFVSESKTLFTTAWHRPEGD